MCLWRCPVDFIGEKDVSEDWAPSEIERRGRYIEYVCAGDIGRHQIWSELDATKARVDNPGDGLHC